MGEPLAEEVEAGGMTKQTGRWPNLAFEQLPGDGHTLRPPIAQRAVHQLFDESLGRLGVEAKHS